MSQELPDGVELAKRVVSEFSDAKHKGSVEWVLHEMATKFLAYREKQAARVPAGRDSIIAKLQACADDPMWADHAEISKSTLRHAIAMLAAAPTTEPSKAEQADAPSDDREEIEAVIACLGDDAAQLRDENPEDERADNMDKAADLLGRLLATQPPASKAEQADAPTTNEKENPCVNLQCSGRPCGNAIASTTVTQMSGGTSSGLSERKADMLDIEQLRDELSDNKVPFQFDYLAEFYKVDTVSELIAAQAYHIEKLQNTMRERGLLLPAFTRVREG